MERGMPPSWPSSQRDPRCTFKGHGQKISLLTSCSIEQIWRRSGFKLDVESSCRHLLPTFTEDTHPQKGDRKLFPPLLKWPTEPSNSKDLRELRIHPISKTIILGDHLVCFSFQKPAKQIPKQKQRKKQRTVFYTSCNGPAGTVVRTTSCLSFLKWRSFSL